MTLTESHPLDGLLYSQRDLARICAERPLDWEEYAHMNEFHGNAATLKRFAGLPLDEPLPFAVEHAIPYDLKKAYDYDLNCALPTFLSIHEESAKLYRTGGMEHVDPIGFTHLYAIELFAQMHPDEPERVRSGTIVFPDKSTLLMDTDFDRSTFARRLAELPDAYQPVVVCIYWRDFVRGQHLPFEEAGLPVVSAGHLRDPDFPLRLHDLCRRFRYSCANDLAGSFVASILSGCHFFHLPTTGLTQQKYGITSHYERDPTLEQPRKAACIAASPFPPQSPDAQRALAEEHAGLCFKKSPEQLREIAAQARVRLQSGLMPGTITLEKNTSAESLRMLHRLLPSGIDRDGWSHKRSRLRVAAKSGIAGACLRLAFMKETDGVQQETLIRLNGRNLVRHAPPPYGPSILVEFDGSGDEAIIEFESQHDFALSGEPRRTAFRIASLVLLTRDALTEAKQAASKKDSKRALEEHPEKPSGALLSRLGRMFGIRKKRVVKD